MFVLLSVVKLLGSILDLDKRSSAPFEYSMRTVFLVAERAPALSPSIEI